MNKIEFAQYVIIVEFTLIFLIVILSYSLIFILRIQRYSRLAYSRRILAYFNEALTRKALPPMIEFKKSWKKIELIVPLLSSFNKRYNETLGWRKIRQNFCETILFPVARNATYRKNWLYRFYAAQAFEFHIDVHNEKYILTLLDDSVPLVFYASLEAAVKISSKSCIIKIVERLSKENWITKSLFMQVFQHASTTTRYIIENILMGSTEPLLRATCYTILLQFRMNRLRWDINEDLNSNVINLKISALKYSAHAHLKNVSSILTLHLKDKSWEVRTVCLRLLGELGARKEIIAIAACLNDPDWWVRLASASTLRSFGPEGIKILESQKEQVNPEAFYAAHNVLNKL